MSSAAPGIADRRERPASEHGRKTYVREAPGVSGGRVELDGIVYSEANPIAVINGRPVRPGAVVGGYTVLEIREDGVVLGYGTRSIFLGLKRGPERD